MIARPRFAGPLALIVLATLTPTAWLHAAQESAESGPYQVYRGDGARASLDEIIEAAAAAEVVLVGEAHDDPTGHALEAELLRGLHAGRGESAGPLILSLEMFERDVQYVLDEYLQGLISEDHFRRSARPWDHYESDYRPLVEFAREHGLAVVAANAPRRYVNLVTRRGPEALEALGERARSFVAPLPYALPSPRYRAEWDSVMAEAMAEAPEARRAEFSGRALLAQSLWDATMAHSIARALTDHPGALVLHVVGSFHVAHRTGIPEHLARYRPATRAVIVVMRPVDDIDTFDPGRDGGGEDFVILTERARTRTANPEKGHAGR